MNLLNNMRIRNKLILSFIIAVFVPVIIVGFFLTLELRKMALNNALDQSVKNVERLKKRTEDLLYSPSDVSYRLLFDRQLSRVVTAQYTSVYDVVKTYNDYKKFQEYVDLYKEIEYFRFFIKNPTMLNNWIFNQPTPEVMQMPWYVDAMNARGLITWSFIEDVNTHKKQLCLIRRIDFLETHKTGVLVIAISTNELESIVSQEPFETMIVDSYNNIVAANHENLTGRSLEDIHLDTELMDHGKGTYDALVDGKKSKIVIEELMPRSSLNGMRIISIYSVESIVKDANRIKMLALSVIIASLFVAVLLVYFFSMLISSRLLRLSKHINKVALGNLTITMQIEGKDEIAQLSRQFNSMVGSIRALMSEIQESNQQKSLLQQKQTEIKLKMLASQINPHFLFNALESIRMRAHLKGEAEISNTVQMLGKMMRKNLEVGSRSIPLKSEIEMIHCYLEIQKFRFGDRLTYKMDVEPAALNVPVPPLILQPLVENAVIHGLENKMEVGCIFISVTRLQDELQIEVVDNGIGIYQEKLEALQSSLEDVEDEKNRIGLRNVHQRLVLTYGNTYGLHIDSKSNQETKVSFRIPLGGDKHV